MPLRVARLRISDYNENRKRNVKNTERKIRMVSLSLTSMVDMFAILVIFLLTNTTTVNQWVEVSHGIVLPKGKSPDVPPKAANIQISKDAIYGDQKELVKVQSLGGSLIIESLKNFLMSKKADKSLKDGYVNVAADQALPFGVIKKVIISSQAAGFGNVNLVIQPRE